MPPSESRETSRSAAYGLRLSYTGRNMSEREAIRRASALLEPHERRRLWGMAALQAMTSFLDLLGILLIGVVALLAAAQAQGVVPPAVVESGLRLVGLADASVATAAIVLAIAAAVLLIAKTIVNLLIIRRATNLLAAWAAEASERVVRRFLSQSLLDLTRQPSQWSAASLSGGITTAIVGVLGSAILIWSEISLLTVLGLALLVVNPVVTLVALVYLAGVSMLIHRLMSGSARRAGAGMQAAEVDSMTAVQNAIATYREVVLADRMGFYERTISEIREAGSHHRAHAQFSQQVPRYGIEAAVIVGAALLLGILLIATDSQTALGTMAIFLAAGTRVMPSVMRLNSARLGLQATAGIAAGAFELVDDLNPRPPASRPVDGGEFAASIRLAHVTFTYPGQSAPAIRDASLDIRPGGSLALVGPTAAGKSTLADLILGILDPQSGTVLVGGLPPKEAARAWPGLIGYVPQSVALVAGSVRDNVAIALDPEAIDDARVREVLRDVHLGELVEAGLDYPVGESGMRLSGGQRQRLGLARALYAQPNLMVLDEATSALDAETEAAIGETLRVLRGEVTLVTIAHRLSTVKDADLVAYIDDGRVLAVGTFDEVRARVPDFDRQAALLGL